MKKLKGIRTIVFLTIIALFIFTVNASANQGFYGLIQTNTEEFNKPDAVVGNATVEVYTYGGSFVGSTTTSACGYYTLSVPSYGIYHLRVVASSCITREWEEENQCGIIGDESVSYIQITDNDYIISGFWNEKNVFYDSDGN